MRIVFIFHFFFQERKLLKDNKNPTKFILLHKYRKINEINDQIAFSASSQKKYTGYLAKDVHIIF